MPKGQLPNCICWWLLVHWGMRTQNLIMFCAREDICTIHIMLNVSMNPIMAFSCNKLAVLKGLLIKKKLIFMYFLPPTALNDLPFNFFTCAFDPVLQDWANKKINLPWPVQMTSNLHKNHIQLWPVTILLPLSVSVVSAYIWRYIKLLEMNLMSVILQTWYCVVADHSVKWGAGYLPSPNWWEHLILTAT